MKRIWEWITRDRVWHPVALGLFKNEYGHGGATLRLELCTGVINAEGELSVRVLGIDPANGFMTIFRVTAWIVHISLHISW
jgi:hypothetical protein